MSFLKKIQSHYKVTATDLADDDQFECEKCHKIFDNDDSVENPKDGQLVCVDCAKKLHIPGYENG